MLTLTNNRAFTLIELMIVVVVIAILASVTIVAYTGVQARANDAKIRSAADHIKDALDIYISQQGKRPYGGWGSSQALTNGNCTNGADGWFAKGTYTCTPDEVLVAQNLIPSDLTGTLPPNKVSGNSSTTVFMLYGCSSTKIVLMWYLQSPSAQDVSSYDAAIGQCNGSPTYRSSYGMQGAALIDI